MIVLKFGGTSVGSAERIRNLFEIVKERINYKPIVVVSAFNGVTDHLISLANSALKGSFDMSWIRERHYNEIEKLGLEKELIDPELNELETALKGITYLKEVNPKVMDFIMSFGERISAKIIAAYFNDQGINAKALNAYDIGLLTDSNFGNAEVLEESYKLINDFFNVYNDYIAIVTGFIAKDLKGNITTLGRGGSDYTATILGAAVNAEEVQIWTDVDGVMTADPKICPKAKTVEELTYEEAYELAYFGAKVLHPKTILPVKKKGIPVRILNTFNPKASGTQITSKINRPNRVAAIACKKKVNILNIHTPKMFLAYGYLYRIFEIFNRQRISVDLISTSEVNVSLTTEDKYDIEELRKELKEIAELEVYNSRATVSIVGQGINIEPNIAGRTFSVLGKRGINIEMISAGSSKINISFVVKQEDADECVRELHREFFENE